MHGTNTKRVFFYIIINRNSAFTGRKKFMDNIRKKIYIEQEYIDYYTCI